MPARTFDEGGNVLLQRFVGGWPDINHVPGLIVPERYAFCDLLVVGEVAEIELGTAHDGCHIVIAARNEDFQKRVPRHRGPQGFGHVHVAVLVESPRPHVSRR